MNEYKQAIQWGIANGMIKLPEPTSLSVATIKRNQYRDANLEKRAQEIAKQMVAEVIEFIVELAPGGVFSFGHGYF